MATEEIAKEDSDSDSDSDSDMEIEKKPKKDWKKEVAKVKNTE